MLSIRLLQQWTAPTAKADFKPITQGENTLKEQGGKLSLALRDLVRAKARKDSSSGVCWVAALPRDSTRGQHCKHSCERLYLRTYLQGRTHTLGNGRQP